MKTIIIGFFLLAFIATGNSQIVLEESRIDVKKTSMEIDPVTQALQLKIPEEKFGEFEKDPLTFMKNKFDVQQFLEDNRNADLSEFHVNFITTKGALKARFDKNGELISSYQKFLNKKLPQDVQLELARLYRNASVEKTKSFAYSKGWEINKEYYKVKLVDGDNVRRVRIDRKNNRLSVAVL